MFENDIFRYIKVIKYLVIKKKKIFCEMIPFT